VRGRLRRERLLPTLISLGGPIPRRLPARGAPPRCRDLGSTVARSWSPCRVRPVTRGPPNGARSP